MEYLPELRTTFCPFLWKSPDHYNAFWELSVVTLKDTYLSRAAKAFLTSFKKSIEET
jgi:hypothetical protein